jgi:16S rRNA C1402 (ribose-2'-O) methylase RsmI
MKKLIIIALICVLVCSAISMNVFAYYGFLSDNSNAGLNRLKEKYGTNYGYYLNSGEYYVPSCLGHIIERNPIFLKEAIELLKEKYKIG